MLGPAHREATYFVEGLVAWAVDGNLRSFPWRGVQNPYRVLLTEIFLRRTRAENIVATYGAFFGRYPELVNFIEAQDSDILSLVAPLGLKWRAKNILQLRDALGASRAIPDTYNGLTDLPGVGDYVASAVLCFVHAEARPLIDANLVRLVGRFFGFDTGPETRRRKWFIDLAYYLISLLPGSAVPAYNYATLDLAAKICRPAVPRCSECCLKNSCAQVRTSENGSQTGEN